jgi:fatty acyl-CoA reductase
MRAVQVTETELFSVVKEKHGKGFSRFIEEKVVALAGDIIYDDLGLDPPLLQHLADNLDVIVNGAATTNFYGRSVGTIDSNIVQIHSIQLYIN